MSSEANDEFLGGFKAEQFDQGGPLQKYWVETPKMLGQRFVELGSSQAGTYPLSQIS